MMHTVHNTCTSLMRRLLVLCLSLFLKVVCCCCAAGKIEGDVRVSGHPKVQETFARIMGYVEQSDIHSPNVRPAPC